MPEELEILAKIVSWPAALAVVAWAFRPVIAAWGSKLKGSESDNTRITSLEEFRTEAEGNHFHDLENVMNDVKQLQRDFTKFQLQMENRISRLEAKVLNGHTQH